MVVLFSMLAVFNSIGNDGTSKANFREFPLAEELTSVSPQFKFKVEPESRPSFIPLTREQFPVFYNSYYGIYGHNENYKFVPYIKTTAEYQKEKDEKLASDKFFTILMKIVSVAIVGVFAFLFGILFGEERKTTVKKVYKSRIMIFIASKQFILFVHILLSIPFIYLTAMHDKLDGKMASYLVLDFFWIAYITSFLTLHNFDFSFAKPILHESSVYVKDEMDDCDN